MRARERLPSGVLLTELIEYEPAKRWISPFLVDSDGFYALNQTPQVLIGKDLDEKLRILLTETLLEQHSSAEGSSEGVGEFQMAISRAISKIWARFSQQIKKAISGAEVARDSQLQAKLMKEYLDVQRKMKEFSSFYDEA